MSDVAVLDEEMVIGAQVENAGTRGAPDLLKFLLDLETHVSSLEVHQSAFERGYPERVRRLEAGRLPFNPGILSLVKSALTNSEADHKFVAEEEEEEIVGPGARPEVHAALRAIDDLLRRAPAGESAAWIRSERDSH